MKDIFKLIMPLIVLLIMGLISYWLIKTFDVLVALPIMLIMTGFPLLFIKDKNDIN